MTKNQAIKAFTKRGKGPSSLIDWEHGDTVSAGHQKITASQMTTGVAMDVPTNRLSKVA